VIETAITGLTLEEQMELVRGISKHLHNQGILPDTVCLFLPPNITILTLSPGIGLFKHISTPKMTENNQDGHEL
jgi:hypothetical protein